MSPWCGAKSGLMPLTTEHGPGSPARNIVVRLETASPHTKKRQKQQFANAKVRTELDMPLRGELIVGVDHPVDSFNQLCAAFPKFANAKVRTELDMPLRGELIVGVVIGDKYRGRCVRIRLGG
jgi:hypothetical protein